MHSDVKEPARTVVPTLRYRDLSAAIEWLCTAFGFTRHLVVPGEDGAVRYAELTFGDGMIMLGPVADTAVDKLMAQPGDVGGAETQICYLFVEDAAAHCARAKAAGAEIVLDIEDEGGSARGYSCRDPEGHIWNFGTYNPGRRQAARAAPPAPRRSGIGARLKLLALGVVLLASVAGSAVVVGWALGVSDPGAYDSEPPAVVGAGERDGGAAAERSLKGIQEQLVRERGAREAAERSARAAKDQLGQERGAKDAAERLARDAQAQSAQERQAREQAERTAREAREQLSKSGAEQALNELREQLVNERKTVATAQRIAEETREQLALAERAAEAVREQLAAEQSAREAAERTSREAQETLAKERKAATDRQQTREQQNKERAAKEAAERAAKEARERSAKKAAPRRRTSEESSSSSSPPFILWQQ
jgi:uncharacterized glyoxalase superfamily protein PhnB